MTTFVLDASVTLCWLLPDEANLPAIALKAVLKQRDALVPPLWHWEVANALMIAQRRGRLTGMSPADLLDALHDLPIITDPQSQSQAWAHTLVLARQHELTAYDAAYLEIAVRKGVPLTTLDTSLRRAALACGLQVLPDLA